MNWNIFKRFSDVERTAETNRRLLALATRDIADIADIEARLDFMEGLLNGLAKPTIGTQKPVRTEKQKAYSRNYYLTQKAKKQVQHDPR